MVVKTTRLLLAWKHKEIENEPFQLIEEQQFNVINHDNKNDTKDINLEKKY